MAVCVMRQVVKRYKEILALNHFDLEVHEGEILGLLGPNGSGKTTSINCLLGLLTYDQGEIELYGKSPGKADRATKNRIGVVPSDLAFFNDLTVLENVNYFAGLYEPDKARRKAMADQALEFTGLEKYRKFAAKKLSGGLKRRLNIACGIAHSPDFLIMDEPTVALDAQSRQYVLDGVRELNQRGATVLYTTHYLDEVQTLCDRIVIMDEGRNLASGSLEELIRLVDPTELVHIEFAEEGAEEDIYAMIRELPGVVDVQGQGGKTLVRLSPPGQHLPGLLEALRARDITYLSLTSELPTLNQVFLSLTGKNLRE